MRVVVLHEDIVLSISSWQDDDHQSKYIPPSSSQEAIGTVKHTWNNLSVDSVKDGISTMTTLAAKEASARLPDRVFRFAATASNYISQAVRRSPAIASEPQQTEGACHGYMGWEPPANSFALADESRALSPGLNWRRERADVQKVDEGLMLGAQRISKRDRSEQATFKQEGPTEHAYRMREQKGPGSEKEKLYYDSLGMSSQWKRADPMEEWHRQRKKRLSEEWKTKEEKKSGVDRG